ncbi:unnamed protein product [Miscanthus lutarioriparius]|uniref:Peptidase C1A papain C-terminal domain-containing protein n=1 Tax=Miscanthus lutarioriparius TaxID=422564 RepID=A0A811NAD6_9POAL|nr:unnamed protein product [Miscanthus lutarioriparius]
MQVWQELRERGGGPKRFRIFSESLQLAHSTNRKGLSYRLGINRFSDMSWEEFRATRLGAAQNCSATLAGNHRMRAAAAALPEKKDWREDGIVSPVKNQGHCGSCWTFSTTGALEAAYTQATGEPISLSEQQLVDCGKPFNNFGCNGGLPSQAFEYIKYNGGLDTEESYPYKGVNGICNFKAENVGVKVLDSVNITLGAEDELKDAVALVRPVSVAFQVINGFRQYKSGVYTSDSCGTTPMDVNHAVLAVGYGIENGVPYWLIKNSWGADWGDEGHFKMEMGKNMCGDIGACDGKFAGDIILGDSMILIPVDIARIGGGIGNRFADGSFNLFASSIQMPSSLLLIRKPSASPITHEAAALVCKKN